MENKTKQNYKQNDRLQNVNLLRDGQNLVEKSQPFVYEQRFLRVGHFGQRCLVENQAVGLLHCTRGRTEVNLI